MAKEKITKKQGKSFTSNAYVSIDNEPNLIEQSLSIIIY